MTRSRAQLSARVAQSPSCCATSNKKVATAGCGSAGASSSRRAIVLSVGSCPSLHMEVVPQCQLFTGSKSQPTQLGVAGQGQPAAGVASSDLLAYVPPCTSSTIDSHAHSISVLWLSRAAAAPLSGMWRGWHGQCPGHVIVRARHLSLDCAAMPSVLHCTACPARASLLHSTWLQQLPHAVSPRASLHASVQMVSKTAGCQLVQPGGLRHRAVAQEHEQGMLLRVTLQAASPKCL